jgi:CheY-like chemotaxis protein
MSLVDFFLDEGFNVFEAQSADHAIAIMEADPAIKIVVTDVQMPGSMDGLRLAHFIRDRWPPTALIVVSGAARPTMDDLPLPACFFSKPVDPRSVLHEIERLHG